MQWVRGRVLGAPRLGPPAAKGGAGSPGAGSRRRRSGAFADRADSPRTGGWDIVASPSLGGTSAATRPGPALALGDGRGDRCGKPVSGAEEGTMSARTNETYPTTCHNCQAVFDALEAAWCA